MKQHKLVEGNIPERISVSVRHYHPGNSSKLSRKGHAYMTTCAIYDKDKSFLGHGEAHCNENDVPSRSRGRMVAVGRAMKEAGFRLCA